MGREVKRVALDFDWPRDAGPWKGFLNPHFVECPNPDCKQGQLSIGWFIQHLSHALFSAGRNAYYGKPVHPWTFGLNPSGSDYGFPDGKHPPGLAGFIAGLAGVPQPELYNGINNDIKLSRALATHAGLDQDYCACKTCEGSGIHPDHQAAYESWEPYEPPAGPGWQLWETVSEGSPISPVFETPEELARWLSDANNLDPHDITRGTSYEQWLAMIQEGYALSMIMTQARGVEPGVQAVARIAAKEV